ncbi:GerMN domain-containing protein [Bacillus sp. FJAT-45350]|uniref:GerMN domain-containing protein n=1 Tax=Bacillus sp. FJAT-45350 TaxID=2011014 RepID=UPI000BB6BBCA|nr:GerMN domain-containing protein [Bacillus sp. FJAT-45350]
MNKIWKALLLSMFTVIILSACGQGGETVDSSDASNGIDVDQNEELLEEVETDISGEASDNREAADNSEAQENVTQEEVTQEEVDTHPVELYFSDNQVENIYRIETTIEGTDEDLFKKTLETWVEGPQHEELSSLITDNVKVQSVEEVEGVAYVSFSKEFLDAPVGSGAEEMLLQQIALMMKQFGFSETQILIDGEIKDQLFGHIDTSEPILATEPSNYEKLD